MQCRKCGAELAPGVTQCEACGACIEFESILSLHVTPSEARRGCTKVVKSAQLVKPLNLRIKRGVKNGSQLVVNNVQVYDADGNEVRRAVRIQIDVRIGKYAADTAKGKGSGKSGLLIGLAIALFVLLVAGVCLFMVLRPGADNPAGTDPRPSGTSPTSGTEQTDAYEPVYEIPYLQQRYFLSRLPDDHMQNIAAMYDSLMAFEETCDLPIPIPSEELTSFLKLLKYECPELLQLDITQEIQYFMNSETEKVEQVRWAYSITPDVFTQQLRACQDVVDALVATTEGMSDEAKQKVAFDFVANSCTYSLDADNAGNAYGVLIERQGKCDGISLAAKWILEDMGIPTFCLFGMPHSGSVGHAWNVVCIDGKYYDLDVTADVRYEDSDKPIAYQAYNVSSTWIREKYTLDDVYAQFGEIPGTDSMEGSYYYKRGQYVPAGESAEEVFSRMYYAAVVDEKGYFAIQFESAEDMELFGEQMESMMKAQSLKHNISRLAWESIFFDDYHLVYVRITD